MERAERVTLTVGCGKMASDGTVTVPVWVSGFGGVTTVQFTLAWDPNVLAFVGVGDCGLPSLDDSNFGFTHNPEGKLTFPTQSGRNYSVEYTDNLTAPHWRVAVGPLVGTGLPIRWIDDETMTGGVPAETSSRFYRVQSQP